MVKKEIIAIDGIQKSDLPFNHVIKAGDTLYLTSQLSCNLHTGEILPGSIQTQTRNTMNNIRYLLENSHSSMDSIVDITVYLRHLDDFKDMNEVYKEYFTRGEEPARVVVKAESPLENVDVEIKVTAIADNASNQPLKGT